MAKQEIQRRLSVEEKMLLHLEPYHKVDGQLEVPYAFCQQGIADAIGILRNAVPRTIKGLKGKGEVYEKILHVEGKQRKIKVYFLTEKGLTHAKQIKEWVGYKGLFFTHNMPKIKYFFGRAGELERSAKCIESNTYKIITIKGIAGTGKTTFSAKVALNYGREMNVFWHQIHEWTTLRNILTHLAEFLQKIGREKLKSYLKQKGAVDIWETSIILEEELDGSNSLLIFDDCHEATEPIITFFRSLVLIMENVSGINIIVIGRSIPRFYDRREVVIKKLIDEIPLDGLDRNSAERLLRKRNIPVSKFDTIYRHTEGHPLFLELIDPARESGEQKDIKKYIEEELFLKLNVMERKILSNLCVHTHPVPKEAIFFEANISHEIFDEMVDRALLKVTKRGFDAHPLIKNLFYERMPSDLKKERHEKAAAYHLSEEETSNSIDAQYHLIMADQHRKAARIAVEKGGELIDKGYAEELLNVLSKLEDKNLDIGQFANILALRGEALYVLGEWDKALEHYTCALGGDRPSKNHVVTAGIHRKIGRIYTHLSEWDEATQSYGKSLHLAEKIGDPSGIAETYRGLAEIHWRNGDYEDAIILLKKCEKQAKHVKNDEILSSAYIDLATIYIDTQEELDKGIRYFGKALNILEAGGRRYEISRLYNNLGVAYKKKENFVKALESYNKCIKISKESGYIRLLGFGLSNAGEIYARKQDTDRASECCDRALGIFKRLNDKYMIALTYQHYGIIYRMQRKWGKSAMHFRRAISILKKLDIPYHLADTYYEFGMMYKDKGDKGRSNQYLKKASDIFKMMGM